MILIGCDLKQHAICTSVFSFYFQYFYDLIRARSLSALNSGVASKVCGHCYCFSVLRLDICACGDDIDGMLFETVCHLHI